jgi:hypothetical protein
MDPLTSLALVGTTRQSAPSAEPGAPVDAVLARLGEVPLERRVLLAAGARAAATMAGRRSSPNDAAVPSCPPETLAPCSPKAARLVGDMLRGHHPELLPEAFARLTQAGQRLPYPLLPDALRVRGDELRLAVRHVIGERGQWLARMNDAWSWASVAPTALSMDALEPAWSDASAAVRRALLVQARGLDAQRARGWLEATWANEKADERAALLAALRTGLSGADEPFIEAQLGDRASTVREAAQALLPHLPESAFVRRMTERADAMIDFKRSALAFVGKRGALTATPPESVDGAAERDGLLAKPPQGIAGQGVGVRAFWLMRTLSAVPLAHWTARFGARADALVAAAESTDWASAVCEGWTRAALISGDPDWLGALWEFWQRSDEKAVTHVIASAMTISILRRMPAADAAARVESLFTDARTRVDLATALYNLDVPWPERLGACWVDALRRDLRAASARAPMMIASVRIAALALPPACFARALEPLDLPGGEGAWERPLAEFSEVLRLRNDLVQ